MTPQSPEQMYQAIDQVVTAVNASVNIYNTPRVSGELDMVQAVRNLLCSVGLGDRLPEAYDANRFIIEAHGKTAIAQQYNLNRYLSIQLMSVDQDATLQRYALIYEVSPKDWLTIFEQNILPALAEFDLPRVI